MNDFLEVVVTHLNVTQKRPDGSYWLFKCPPFCDMETASEGVLRCRLWKTGEESLVEGALVGAD